MYMPTLYLVFVGVMGVFSRIVRVLAVCVLSLSLCACGGASEGTLDVTTASSEDVGAWGVATPSSEDGYVMSNGEIAESSRDIEADESSRDIEDGDGMWVSGSKVSLSTKDFDAASATLSELMSRHGCVVLSDSSSSRELDVTSHESDVTYKTRDVMMRVPAEELDALRQDLEGGDWTVESISISGRDIASEYHDWEAELDSLQQRYDWYSERIAKTEDEALANEYFEELTQITKKMDNVRQSMENAKVNVAWSRVAVRLFEDVSLRDDKRAAGAWQVAFEAMLQLPARIAYVLGRLVYLIVMVLPYGLVVALVVFGVRRLSRDSDRRRAERLDAMRAGKGAGEAGEVAEEVAPDVVDTEAVPDVEWDDTGVEDEAEEEVEEEVEEAVDAG